MAPVERADGPKAGPIEGFGPDGRPLRADALHECPRIEIDEALRKGWFEFWYQPKIDLKRKRLAGAEALARIRHPTYGVMRPGAFVPVLGTASIERLTEYTLVATLQSWSVFQQAGFNLSLAINVPVSVLLALPIPALVEQYRPKSKYWPGVILEVLEDQIAREVKLAQAVAKHLQIDGIKIAIDNFGAGYSSLSSLRELPFSELKIDHSFVRSCASDAANAAICQTVIDLAHRFGSAAVAEGIESRADLQALTAMGCDFGQGALIAPPMALEQFLELLLQRVNKPRANIQAAQPVKPAETMNRAA